MKKNVNRTANEALSKFKLLSAYGGPGSVIHTEYGSVVISCMEEWGFINRVKGYIQEAHKINKDEKEHVEERAKAEDIQLSNDERLLAELKAIKQLSNLKYLVLIPDIEINDTFNTIAKEKTPLAINSTFLPKGFFDRNNNYRKYKDWYNDWPEKEQADFFPPKYRVETTSGSFSLPLMQDNILLICEHGHISDFPWSKYLKWRSEHPEDVGKEVDLFSRPDCCSNPIVQIKETSASASGFDSKWLKCGNKGCGFAKGISLKGLMSTKIKCPGHKPWEATTGNFEYYFGDRHAREQNPPYETCTARHLRVALSTANNLYFSRILSSIYMPPKIFLSADRLKLLALREELNLAIAKKEFGRCEQIHNEIKILESKVDDGHSVELPDSQRELQYRYAEYKALTSKTSDQINVSDDLRVMDVTGNLTDQYKKFFRRVLRIDNLKVTSAQLDFARVEPVESESDKHRSKNIFRSAPELVQSYPVVTNYGEGIFIAFDESLIQSFKTDNLRFKRLIDRARSDFARNAVNIARLQHFPLYLIHTFCHLLMRELEFRCGYPTASLSERLFVSPEKETRMYGLMIYTAEGAEGSMGGLIAQTRPSSLNTLIASALTRSTVCQSDPLCWESEGQGLFELNMASCFACGLVSETSCEQRNIFLDRRILVDEDFGFFKDIL
jgi:hypothetical protein